MNNRSSQHDLRVDSLGRSQYTLTQKNGGHMMKRCPYAASGGEGQQDYPQEHGQRTGQNTGYNRCSPVHYLPESGCFLIHWFLLTNNLRQGRNNVRVPAL